MISNVNAPPVTVIGPDGKPITFSPPQIGNEFDFQAGTFSSLGAFKSTGTSFSSSGTLTISDGALSTVPLPASAPMFGAALLALASFGYGMNRWVAPKGKKEAATA